MKEYFYFLVAVLFGIIITTTTMYLFGFEATTVGAFSFIFGKLLYNDVFKK